MDTCTYTYTKFLLEMAIYIYIYACANQHWLLASCTHVPGIIVRQADRTRPCASQSTTMIIITLNIVVLPFDDGILYMNDSIRSYHSHFHH